MSIFLKRALLVIFAAVLAGGIASLQFLDEKFINGFEDDIPRHIFQHLHANKLVLTFLGITLVTFISLFEGLFAVPRKELREIRLLVMAEILDDLFEGDKANVRITIFQDVSWLRVIWIHFYPLFRHPIKWWSMPKSARPKFEDGKYLCVTDRIGSGRESKTFFYYDPKVLAKSQGVAGRARQIEGVVITQGLPDISSIDLHNLDMNITNDSNVKRVNNYMRRGHINDFETLKRLHRKARHFYGNILFNKKNVPKGVLVIDDMRAKKPFDDETQNRLEHYVKLLYPTM